MEKGIISTDVQIVLMSANVGQHVILVKKRLHNAHQWTFRPNLIIPSARVNYNDQTQFIQHKKTGSDKLTKSGHHSYRDSDRTQLCRSPY